MPPNKDYDQWMEGEGSKITSIVRPFYQDAFAASCAYIRRMDRVAFTQGWILGRDEYSAEPPSAAAEGNVLRVLSLAETRMKELEHLQGRLDIQVGDRRIAQALRA